TLTSDDVLDQPKRHAHAGCAKAPMPRTVWIEPHRSDEVLEPLRLSQKANNYRRKKRAEIDTHVKNRKARVAPLVLLMIQLADHRADVRLQQSGPACNQNQARVEIRDRVNGH